MTYQHALRYLAANEISASPHLPYEPLCRALFLFKEKPSPLPLIVCFSHDKQASTAALFLRSILLRAGIGALHLIHAPEYDPHDCYILNGTPISPTLLCPHAHEIRALEIKLRRTLTSQGRADSEATFPPIHRKLAVLLRCMSQENARVLLIESALNASHLHALCDLLPQPYAITVMSATDEGGRCALSSIHAVTREVISHPCGSALFRACSDTCSRTGSRLGIIARSSHSRHSVTPGGQTLNYAGIRDCRLCSGSALSADAAVLAAEAALALRRAGAAISNEAIKLGLSQTVLPMCTSPVSIHPLTVAECVNNTFELAYAMRDLEALSDALAHPRYILIDPHLRQAFAPHAHFADTILEDVFPHDTEQIGCLIIIGSADFVRQRIKTGAKK